MSLLMADLGSFIWNAIVLFTVSLFCDCELRVDWVDSETQGPSTSSFIHDNFSLQHRLMKLEDLHCLRHVWMLEYCRDMNISDRYQSVSDIWYDGLIYHHCGSFCPTDWLPLSQFDRACGLMATERQGLPLSELQLLLSFRVWINTHAVCVYVCRCVHIWVRLTLSESHVQTASEVMCLR